MKIEEEDETRANGVATGRVGIKKKRSGLDVREYAGRREERKVLKAEKKKPKN